MLGKRKSNPPPSVATAAARAVIVELEHPEKAENAEKKQNV
jgi:hypothetical protein